MDNAEYISGGCVERKNIEFYVEHGTILEREHQTFAAYTIFVLLDGEIIDSFKHDYSLDPEVVAEECFNEINGTEGTRP